MDDTNRVKFYSTSDFSLGFYLDRIEAILNAPIAPHDINDIVELYNIQKFINNKIFGKDWSPSKIYYFQQQVSRLNSIIPIWIVNHKTTLIETVSNLYTKYKTDFWELVGKYNISKDWNDSYFQELSSVFSLYDILPYKTIVRRFNLPLAERLENDEDALDCILKYYVFLDDWSQKIFLPEKLDIYTIELIMNRYLKKRNPSFRNLEGIISFPKINHQRINNKTKKTAKQKLDKIHESYFNQDNPPLIEYSFGVSFSPEIEEKTGYVFKSEENKFHISYSSNWIINNNDYPTLLNNFIYLFDFVDPKQMRFLLYNNKRNYSSIDFVSDQKLQGGFNPNFSFQQDLNIKKLQMSAYYHFLKNVIGITIEDLVVYFFSEYLPREFSIEGFQICMPTKETTYLEKCKIIAPELENLMKSYHHFADDGIESINFLEFDSDKVPIDLISSLLPNKYVYPEPDLFDIAAHHLCSNQSMLSYLKNKNKSFNSFIELLLNEVVFLKDYHPIYIRDIQWLCNYGFIEMSENQRLILKKSSFIVYDLFKYGHMSWWHIDNNTKQILKKLELKELVRITKRRQLFSEQECDLYNYILNNTTFTDSLGIRNKYAHGNIDRSKPNSQEHHDNYMLFLLLLINFVIKVNDELCIETSRQIEKSIRQ